MSRKVWEHDGPHKLRIWEIPRGGLEISAKSSTFPHYIHVDIEEAHELMNALSRWLEREVVGPVERGV